MRAPTFALALLAVTAVQVHAQAIVRLPMLVRDFAAEHPDFQEDIDCGLATGMVLDSLGADGRPLRNPRAGGLCRSDSLDAWFRDRSLPPGWHLLPPAQRTELLSRHNASTCTDLTLARATNGNLVFDSERFFPIDGFTTLPDGQINPFNQLPSGDWRGGGDSARNFHFCVEVRSRFDYRPGQSFRFRGDDDLWVFIDGRLAVDVGGVHGPTEGSVNLDGLGLVPGRSYPFALFFCERKTSGSNMRIETDLGLTPAPLFTIEATDLPGRGREFAVRSSGLADGHCGIETENLQDAPGNWFLIDRTTGRQIALNAGTTASGILIQPNLARGRIDTTLLSDLEPGDWRLEVRARDDESVRAMLEFVIPSQPPSAAWVTPSGRTAFVGDLVPLDVGAFRGRQPVEAVTSFSVPATPGLSVFLDPAGLLPLDPGTTLRTPDDGTTVRLWVRGDSIGTFALALRERPGARTDLDTTGPLIFAARPYPVRGWLLDLDGDGRIETVGMGWDRGLAPADGLSGLRVRVGDDTTLIRNVVPPMMAPTSGSIRLPLASPLPFGLTAPGPEARMTGWGGFSLSLHDSVPAVVDTAWLLLTTDYDTPDTLVWVASEPAALIDLLPGLDWRRDSSFGNGTGLPQIGRSTAAGPDTFRILVNPPGQEPVVLPGHEVRIPPGRGPDAFGNVPSILGVWRPIGAHQRPPFFDLAIMQGLMEVEGTPVLTDTDRRYPLQIHVAGLDTLSWRIIDSEGHPTDFAAPDPAPWQTNVVLVADRPTRFRIWIYDLVGTFVAYREADVEPEDLERLGTDRLGRVRVRLLWNGHASSGRPVTSGVYLMRVLALGSVLHEPFAHNVILRLGVRRP